VNYISNEKGQIFTCLLHVCKFCDEVLLVRKVMFYPTNIDMPVMQVLPLTAFSDKVLVLQLLISCICYLYWLLNE
jgi:hypothetical protein